MGHRLTRNNTRRPHTGQGLSPVALQLWKGANMRLCRGWRRGATLVRVEQETFMSCQVETSRVQLAVEWAGQRGFLPGKGSAERAGAQALTALEAAH